MVLRKAAVAIALPHPRRTSSSPRSANWAFQPVRQPLAHHHDGEIRYGARYARERRGIDDIKIVGSAHPASLIEHRVGVAVGSNRGRAGRVTVGSNVRAHI